ncbi:MAG: DUF58 domain-containing protein [Planctomycetota bacterium]
MNDPFELLEPRFLEQARALRIVARRVAPAGRWAEHRSKDRGQGMEFRDFRPYSEGDELKSIDWNVYRRLGRVVVRLYEEMEDLPIYLLPDFSQSMWHETPARAVTAMKVCIGLSSIGLDQHDRVGLFPFGEELEPTLRPTSGRGRLNLIAQALTRAGEAAQKKASGTDLASSLARFRGFGLREGLLVIISDFFDPAGVESMLEELKRTRHRPLLIGIGRQQDRQPELSGDLQVRDCETGDVRDVSINDDVLRKYAEAYDQHFANLEQFATSRKGGFLIMDHDLDVMEQLAGMFEGGRYVA